MPLCTICSQETPNEFSEHQDDNIVHPTGGLHLSINTGYGMFADPMDQKSYISLTNIRLCHDCSIKLIDLFPQEFKNNLFAGGHPIEVCRTQSNTHPNGCRYSWT